MSATVRWFSRKGEKQQPSAMEQEQMTRLLNKSVVVISDQLNAAVDEVDQSIGHLTDITEGSVAQEAVLRNASQTAMRRIQEASSISNLLRPETEMKFNRPSLLWKGDNGYTKYS